MRSAIFISLLILSRSASAGSRGLPKTFSGFFKSNIRFSADIHKILTDYSVFDFLEPDAYRGKPMVIHLLAISVSRFCSGTTS